MDYSINRRSLFAGIGASSLLSACAINKVGPGEYVLTLNVANVNKYVEAVINAGEMVLSIVSAIDPEISPIYTLVYDSSSALITYLSQLNSQTGGKITVDISTSAFSDVLGDISSSMDDLVSAIGKLCSSHPSTNADVINTAAISVNKSFKTMISPPSTSSTTNTSNSTNMSARFGSADIPVMNIHDAFSILKIRE